jgi:hypothetical protein
MNSPSKSVALPVVLLSGLSALLALHSAVGFIHYFNGPLRGDLLLRAEELRSVLRGLNPASVNVDFGYPAWAYITSMLWFLPFGINHSVNFYLFIQVFILCSLGLFLLVKFKSSLPLQFKVILLLGSLPWFPVREQVNFLNYGIIVLGGLAVFVFSQNLTLKGLGLGLALIKPSLCIPAIIVSLFRGSDAKSIAKPLVIAFAVLAAQAAIALRYYSGSLESVAQIFARYLPAGNIKNSFFVSGDYGILNKLVKSHYLSELSAITMLLVAMVVLMWWLRFRHGKYSIDDYDFQLLSFALVPLFTFYRSHDLVLIWPAIYMIVLRICEISVNHKQQMLALPILFFAIYYRGSGGASLYLYSASLIIYFLARYSISSRPSCTLVR